MRCFFGLWVKCEEGPLWNYLWDLSVANHGGCMRWTRVRAMYVYNTLYYMVPGCVNLPISG